MQGHGEVLLRGEIEDTLDASIGYLQKVDHLVRERIARGIPRTGILDITIEECGLSRIPLGGLVQKLHQANLLTLYDAYRSEMRAAAPAADATHSDPLAYAEARATGSDRSTCEGCGGWRGFLFLALWVLRGNSHGSVQHFSGCQKSPAASLRGRRASDRKSYNPNRTQAVSPRLRLAPRCGSYR